MVYDSFCMDGVLIDNDSFYSFGFIVFLDSFYAIDVSMQVTRPDGSLQKEYNNFSNSMGSLTGGDFQDNDTVYPLVINGNSIDKESTGYVNFITSLANNYGVSYSEAETVFADSDLYQSICRAVDDNGGWYKESTRTFVIREFSTSQPLRGINFVLSDKIDITSGAPNTGTTADDIFKQGYYARLYLSVYLKDKVSTTQTSSIFDKTSVGTYVNAVQTGTVLINKLHINNTDFIIPDATTADMRK